MPKEIQRQEEFQISMLNEGVGHQSSTLSTRQAAQCLHVFGYDLEQARDVQAFFCIRGKMPTSELHLPRSGTLLETEKVMPIANSTAANKKRAPSPAPFSASSPRCFA